MTKFKKHLKKLQRKDNFSNRSNYVLNLDRNENITGYSKAQNKKLYKFLLKKKINYYPNLKEQYHVLSKSIKVKKENILFTEGVSGAIKNIMDSLELNRKSEIIYPNPSFALYEIYTKIYNVRGRVYCYNKNFKLDYNKIYDLINKNTVIVFLPLPNIPIEGEIKEEQINSLINRLDSKNIMVAIDEVYFPFGQSKSLNLIKKYKNLIIMRSFSKAYGLAGARIGYLVSSKNNIKVLNLCKGGYETNILSVSAAEFIIKNKMIVEEYVSNVKSGVKYVKNELNKLNLTFYGGINGNYILINFKSKKIATQIYKKLLINKISVRYGFKNIFKSSLLVTIGPKKEMKFFIRNLKKII